MTAAAINSREKVLAGGLAFAAHVLFLILLVFGVSWQHKQINSAVVVDLWRELPTVTPPKAESPPKVEPPPKPAAKPEPPPPEPKVEVKPPPKPEPAPAPKPDIALKEKLEKERKLKEQQAAEAKQRALEKARAEAAEKKRQAEAEALKKKRAAEAEALKKKQAAEAAEKALAAEKQKARDALAAQQAAAAQREIDKYMDGIRTKVRQNVLVPPSLQGNPEAEVEVTLLPGGEVFEVRIRKSSGNAAYDAAVESAIRKSRTFAVPSGEQFQRYFRRFTMAFRPVQ